MKIFRGFSDPTLKRARRSVAIGVFDGVHRGHKRILEDAVRRARRRGLRSTVVTFDPHPSRVLGGKKDAAILSLPHRLRFFEALGLDEALVVRFNRRFAGATRERFLEKTLVARLGMRSLSVGPDFRFGKKGAGDVRYLAARADGLGFDLSLVAPLEAGGKRVSSTRIRKLIEKGELREAARLLGRPVSLYGNVVHGRGRGRRVGFPTANVNPHHEALPPAGVYAVWGLVGERKLKGVLHVGERPTFGDREPSVEAHFPGFRGNLYSRNVEIVFAGYIRELHRFENALELANQIRKDIRKSLKILK